MRSIEDRINVISQNPQNSQKINSDEEELEESRKRLTKAYDLFADKEDVKLAYGLQQNPNPSIEDMTRYIDSWEILTDEERRVRSRVAEDLRPDVENLRKEHHRLDKHVISLEKKHKSKENHEVKKAVKARDVVKEELQKAEHFVEHMSGELFRRIRKERDLLKVKQQEQKLPENNSKESKQNLHFKNKLDQIKNDFEKASSNPKKEQNSKPAYSSKTQEPNTDKAEIDRKGKESKMKNRAKPNGRSVS